jgi:hypothetical protein
LAEHAFGTAVAIECDQALERRSNAISSFRTFLEGGIGMWYRIWPFVLGALISMHAVAQVETQKDSANGVTIAVTPGDLSREAKIWDFAIVLDSHSQDLSDDLMQSAVLVDGQGKEFKPVGWDGAAPGGHHRAGVVKFNTIAPRPQAVELRITRPGEAKPRSFRWDLN